VWPAGFGSVIAVAAEEEASALGNGDTDSKYWDILATGVDKESGITGSSIAAAHVTHKLLKTLLAKENTRKNSRVMIT
jgi:hypothetical protein